MDDNLGPVAVSIKKEKVNTAVSDSPTQYRLIIRTSEVSWISHEMEALEQVLIFFSCSHFEEQFLKNQYQI